MGVNGCIALPLLVGTSGLLLVSSLILHQLHGGLIIGLGL